MSATAWNRMRREEARMAGLPPPDDLIEDDMGIDDEDKLSDESSDDSSLTNDVDLRSDSDSNEEQNLELKQEDINTPDNSDRRSTKKVK